MPARNVTHHLAEFVDASVDSGRFQNAREVVREALRLQREHELKLEALRQALDLGLKDAASGRTRIVEAGEIRGYLRGLGRTARA